MNQPLLQIENLHVVFDTPFGESHALRGVSFAIQAGQIFGVVGESGCGKSMTARSILGIVPHPGKVVKGRILFEGQDLRAFGERQMQKIRGRRIAMIFQNPKQALNPVFTVGQQLLDVMKHHQIVANKKALYKRALQLLGDVGLPQSERILNTYPHRLSGGQQQRVMIAMALSTEPDLLLADEPTTALDVTIQAQILDLLLKLQQKRGLTIMLITHDMGVVAKLCHHVAVLYAGRVVEQGPVREIFKKSKHPYTQGLLTTLPHPGSRGHALNVIAGSVPSGFTPIAGCAFASRCKNVMDVCQQQLPPWYDFENNHQAACFLYDKQVKDTAS